MYIVSHISTTCGWRTRRVINRWYLEETQLSYFNGVTRQKLIASFISNANSFEAPLQIQCNFSNSIIYCLLSGEYYFEGLPFPIPYLWFTKWWTFGGMACVHWGDHISEATMNTVLLIYESRLSIVNNDCDHNELLTLHVLFILYNSITRAY